MASSQSDAPEAGSACIACAIENRAKEVGLAILDKSRMRLYVLQLIEVSRSFTHSLEVLAKYQPSHIVVVASSQPAWQSSVNQATQHIQQVELPRGAFDDTRASLVLEQVASNKTAGDIEELRRSCYLALGAAGALLHYLEEEESVCLTAGSLEVEQLAFDGHMQIDPATVQALELIAPYEGSLPRNACLSSLFRWLNRTQTKPGARQHPT